MNLRKMQFTSRVVSGNRGSFIIEMVVAIFMIVTFLGGVFSVYLNTTRVSYDNVIVTQTEEQARAVLDMIAFDVRMAGSGMPLGQDNFSITDASLGDAPYPVLLTSTNNHLYLRLNETGITTMLKEDYTPSAASLSFEVVSTEDLSTGSTIYISNSTAGGEDGLKGTITNIINNVVTIGSDYVATPGATFEAGSTVARVSTIEYDGTTSTGIKRNDGTDTVTLAENSILSVEYHDEEGNVLTPPLSPDELANDLTSIDITVTVSSDRPLKRGIFYTATAEQEIAIRNLNLTRW